MVAKNIVILLAGGKGVRFSSDIPKQYLLLHNKPILYYSLVTFLNHNAIDLVLPVIHEDHQDVFIEMLNKYNLNHHTKLMDYVIGGKERQFSVYNALKTIKHQKLAKVLIHDSARPLVSESIISNIIKNITPSQGCIPVLPITDSLKLVSKNKYIQEAISREHTVRVQTPQGFPYIPLLEAYNKYVDYPVTDDAGIFMKDNYNVFTILGNALNNKITTMEDLTHLQYLTNTVESRVGQGFDVHAFTNDKKLTLGGIVIPYFRGLEGHSDADVVMHAVVDALLGAINAGDIGDHFPPTDPQWKDANSKIFLLHAKKLLDKRGATINNLDITILCEAPKLGQYKTMIANNIARLLTIETEKVNVKATTTEKLGFIGRKEGIAASVIASIVINKFITPA